MSERPENPYVGPSSFKEDQRGRFFGRDYEGAELLARIIANKLSLYYAQSGAGKSSLINASIVPALRKEGFKVLPIGRVSGFSAINATLAGGGDESSSVKNIFAYNLMLSLDQSQVEIQAAEESEGQDGKPQEKLQPYAELELAQFLARLTIDDQGRYSYSAGATGDEPPPGAVSGSPHILIIDQFEEILTTNIAQWSGRMDFFRQLGEAMRLDSRLWVVLTLREDYVAALDPFAHLLPGKLNAGFYMQRMERNAALEAITRPAELAGRPFEDDAAEQLVDKLSQIRVHGQEEPIPGQFVEPVQLQVVCHLLWEKLEARDKKRGEISTSITSDDLTLAPVDRALGDFYDNAVTETMAAFPKISEIALRTWFEDELITSARTRGTVYQDEDATGSLANNVVEFLQRRYLLRGESRAGGRWIELIHDSFVEPILEANRRWKEKNPLIKAALAWHAAEEDESLLYEGTTLAEALKTPNWRDMGRVVQNFLVESQDKEAGSETVRKMRRLEAKKHVAESGWGIIFASDADPAVEEALSELLRFRRGQAGELFRLFKDKDGYRPGETVTKFLARHGVGPGPVNPEKMPYFLLLVGSPEEIPWSFQYQLNLGYGVGRIHFDTLDDYARYARSVVTVGQGLGSQQLPRRAFVVGITNPDDRATPLARQYLAEPLFEELGREHPSWRIDSLFGEEATKANFSRLFNGDQRPALLFTSSHVVDFPSSDNKQRQHTGALLCHDWPGPKAWKGPITPDLYFSADDVADEARLLGMVAFLWGGSTVGMSRFDSFSKQAFKPERPEVSPEPFVSKLPQRLLSHPNGGALAVIGHVERAWGYSFTWPNASGPQIDVFRDALARMVDGYPVGAAMEGFGRRYGWLAAVLSMELEEIEFGKKEDPYELSGLWTAANDARNYVIFGDPAVSVAVGQETELTGEWPAIEPVQVTQPPAPDIPPPAPPEPAVEAPPPLVAEPVARGVPQEESMAEPEEAPAEQLLFFNGIDGDSGDYRLPPMTAEQLSAFIQGEAPPENLDELRRAQHRRTVSKYL